MRNISKWILTSSILTIAFACESKTSSQNSSEQNQQQKQNQNSDECNSKSDVEKSASDSTGVQKSSISAPPIVEKSTQTSLPISMAQKPVSTVAQEKAKETRNEKTPLPSPSENKPISMVAPVISTRPVTVPAPEVKAETQPDPINDIEHQKAPIPGSK